jgi:hypothetical protein
VTLSNTEAVSHGGKFLWGFCVGLESSVWRIYSKYGGKFLQASASACASKNGKPTVRRGCKA